MSNIAEGFGRHSDKDFAHFLDVARGSCAEVQSLLYVALDAEYIAQPDFGRLYELADATLALIAAFSNYLRGQSG
jgi:four helix bundle protein